MEPKFKLGRISIFAGLLLFVGLIPGASPLAAQDVTVASADPDTAEQGTLSLDVTIKGSGYKKGAKAQWFITGTTNPGGITVNSTTVVNGNELRANITVAADAQTQLKFDIYVTSGGRTGKGIELFSVKQSGQTTCGANVTSVLYDTDSSSVPFQVQSDGKGAYTTYGNPSGNKDSVASAIQGSCSWVLNTQWSLSRAITLTFAYPASSSPPPPPFVGPTTVPVVINNLCSNNPANPSDLSFGNMTFAGQALSCPMRISFDFDRIGNPNYTIVMNPRLYAGASWMQVKCTGVSSGVCNAWTVLPDSYTGGLNAATNQFSALGELVQLTKSGEVPMGLYYISFSFLVHK